MTCKDCICYDLCHNNFKHINFDEEMTKQHCCVYFKDKSKLIELPCRVGDVVYVIPSKCNYQLNVINRHPENNRVYKQEVHAIQMWKPDKWCLWTCDGVILLLQESYNETWFLSKEEAEAKLEELRKGWADG